MGLNKLYFDHQLTVIRAARSHPSQRLGFELMAANKAGQIGLLQRSLGAPAARGWERFAADPHIIQAQGSYAAEWAQNPPLQASHRD
jgi:hypothetical protein